MLQQKMGASLQESKMTLKSQYFDISLGHLHALKSFWTPVQTQDRTCFAVGFTPNAIY